jgi:hypothetical protein
MIMTSKMRTGSTMLLMAWLGGLAACADTPPTAARDAELQARVPAAADAARGGPAAPDWTAADELVQRQLAELRRATAEFHRPEQAEAAGYTVLVAHPTSGAVCLEDAELGGMGRHLLNPDLIDDEVLVPSPEALIYEPGPNGELRLVGVEYVIPFAIRGTDAAPPVLFDQEFKQNFTFDLWALHVWPWKHNPTGMFADWNPSVSCQHDEHVGS